VAGLVGAGVALLEAQEKWKERKEKVSAVRDEGIRHLLKEIPQAILNGATGEDRVANNINISIPSLDTEYATVVLDKRGFAVSTKSACSGSGGGESSVVREISADPARAVSTLRITLGPDTSFAEIVKLSEILKDHIDKMKEYTV
jgi:cysteine desulfurase